MAVRIRLRRMGRKKLPHYRVVVTDRASPREGRFVEALGHYKPLMNPARLVLDLERVDYWIGQGAVPSDTVSSLIQKARRGGDDTLAIGEVSVEEEKAKKANALAAKRKVQADKAQAEKAAAAETKAAAAEAKAAAAETKAAAAETKAAAAETKAAAAETKAAAAEKASAPEAEAAESPGSEGGEG